MTVGYHTLSVQPRTQRWQVTVALSGHLVRARARTSLYSAESIRSNTAGRCSVDNSGIWVRLLVAPASAGRSVLAVQCGDYH